MSKFSTPAEETPESSTETGVAPIKPESSHSGPLAEDAEVEAPLGSKHSTPL
jgi:hypothetical protein